MDYLLATNPVAPLPKGFLSFNQCLANLAIPDLINSRDSFLPQPIYSVGIVAERLISGFEFQQLNSKQPALDLPPQRDEVLSLFK